MLGSLTRLNVRIGSDITEFQKTAAKLEKAVEPFRRRLQKLGTTLSVAVTAPIIALGAKSVQAWDKQAKAVAKVENAIKSTGGAAGRTLQQLQKAATDLQQKTLFGDEEILEGATAQLLTFTNIAGEQFERTQAVALDLATMLGTDLKSASIQLGKALNDPVANLSALSRSGIQFSASQKEVIKALAESGRLAEAQNVILEELERQYGGTAEAAAMAGTGPLTQLKNSLGDLTEEFGKIILEAITPLIGVLRSLVDWFSSLSDGTKKTIVIVATMAAVIGPLLIALGSLAQLIPVVAAGFTLLAGPVGLVIAGAVAMAGLAVLVYKNWDAVRELFEGSLGTAMKFVVSAIYPWIPGIENIVPMAVMYLDELMTGVNTSMNSMDAVFDEEEINKRMEEARKKAEEMTAVLMKAGGTGGDQAKDYGMIDFLAILRERRKGMAEAAPMDGLIDVEALTENLPALVDAVTETADMLEPELTRMEEYFARTKMRLDEAVPQMAQTIKSGFQDAAAGMVEGIGRMLVGAESMGGVVLGVLSSLADLAIRVGKIALGVGIGIEAIEESLKTLQPGPAIAAGVALIALGSAAKAALSSAAGGGGSRGAPLRSAGFGETSSFTNANDVQPDNRFRRDESPEVRIVMESSVTPAGNIAYSFSQGSRRLARQGTDER